MTLSSVEAAAAPSPKTVAQQIVSELRYVVSEAFGEGAAAAYDVIAPSDAEETVAAYLAMMPRS
jgi:hypothetical protein